VEFSLWVSHSFQNKRTFERLLIFYCFTCVHILLLMLFNVNKHSTTPLIWKSWDLRLFEFSRFCIFMQKNFNADKISNKNSLFWGMLYLQFTVCSSWEIRKYLKSYVLSSSSSNRCVKDHSLCHTLTKQVQISCLLLVVRRPLTAASLVHNGELKNSEAPVLNMISIGKCCCKKKKVQIL
jgi:hypothetical protein